MRLGVASLILRLFCCDDGMDERSAVSIDGVAHRLNSVIAPECCGFVNSNFGIGKWNAWL
jgi:hypothetical protein